MIYSKLDKRVKEYFEEMLNDFIQRKLYTMSAEEIIKLNEEEIEKLEKERDNAKEDFEKSLNELKDLLESLK